MTLQVRRNDWPDEKSFRAIQQIVEKIRSLENIIGSQDGDVWTPTHTLVANLDGSTVFQGHYIRFGNTVHAGVKVSVNPTAPGVETKLGISLPIASDFNSENDCSGVAGASGIAGQVAAVRADPTNNRAELVWIAGDISNQSMYLMFSYEVVE